MSRVLIFVAVLLGLAGCAGLGVEDVYRAPTFSHDGSRLTALSWQRMQGRSRILIDNPNAYRLPVTAFQAELWLDGEPWVELDSPTLDGLAAGSATTLELDWSLLVAGLADRAVDAYDAGEVELTLQLSPTLDVPVLGPRRLQWQQSFQVPVPRLPQVRLVDWRLASAGLTELSLDLDLLLDNPNRFNLATGPLQLAVRNGDAGLTSVRLEGMTLDAGEKRVQSTRLTLDYGDLGVALAQAIRSGDWPSDLNLAWSAPLRSPDLGLALPAFSGEVTP